MSKIKPKSIRIEQVWVVHDTKYHYSGQELIVTDISGTSDSVEFISIYNNQSENGPSQEAILGSPDWDFIGLRSIKNVGGYNYLDSIKFGETWRLTDDNTEDVLSYIEFLGDRFKAFRMHLTVKELKECAVRVGSIIKTPVVNDDCYCGITCCRNSKGNSRGDKMPCSKSDKLCWLCGAKL